MVPDAGACSGDTIAVDVLLSFGAALLSLRLAGLLLGARRYAWAGGLAAFAAAAAAMAWGAAHGWDARTFRVYYLSGALLSAPLLGVGSLQLWGKRWAAPLGLACDRPCDRRGGRDAGSRRVRRHGCTARAGSRRRLSTRLLAIAGSSLGTVAVVVVAFATLRRRPFANALMVGAVAAAATPRR